jgi:rhamnose transport system permease protein
MNAFINKFFAIREVPVFIALVIVFIVTSIANPAILSRSGALDIFLGVTVVALLAVGQSLVIVMKYIDLSVSSTIGFSAWLIGKSTADGHSLGYTLTLITLMGLAVGATNGFLVGYMKLPSLVVTLSTMYIVRGLFSQISSGRTIIESEVPSPVSLYVHHRLCACHCCRTRNAPNSRSPRSLRDWLKPFCCTISWNSRCQAHLLGLCAQ